MSIQIPKLTTEQKKDLEGMDEDMQTLKTIAGKLDRARFPSNKVRESIAVLDQKRKGLLKEFG